MPAQLHRGVGDPLDVDEAECQGTGKCTYSPCPVVTAGG
jgi:hypothetical protein